MTALADLYDDQLDAAKDVIPAKQAQTYNSAGAILDADIDAIYIATPPYLHPEHFERAVASGKHILMEKPVGVDPAGVKRVLAAAQNLKPGQTVVIDFQQRYGADYRDAYERVINGELGRIGMVRSAWIGSGCRGAADIRRRRRRFATGCSTANTPATSSSSKTATTSTSCAGSPRAPDLGHGLRQARFPDRHRQHRRLVFGDLQAARRPRLHARRQPDHVPRRLPRCGRVLHGRAGTIATTRQGYTLWLEGMDPVEKRTPGDITKNVVDEFIQSARGEIPTRNDVAEACESTLTAIMGRTAYEQEREVTWDEVLAM